MTKQKTEGSSEIRNIPVVAWKAPDGTKTCALNFKHGSVCRFLKTRKFGTVDICGLSYRDLERADNGKGFITPEAECPVWDSQSSIATAASSFVKRAAFVWGFAYSDGSLHALSTKHHSSDMVALYLEPTSESQEAEAWAFVHSDGSVNSPSTTEHSAGMVPLYR